MRTDNIMEERINDRILKKYTRRKQIKEYDNFISLQVDSFRRFKYKGIGTILNEISPIVSNDGRYLIYLPCDDSAAKELNLSYWYTPPQKTLEECRIFRHTYASTMEGEVAILDTKTGRICSDIVEFFALPEITENGNYVINGTEKTIITQLVKSPGAYYEYEIDPISEDFTASIKITPERGSHIVLSLDSSNIIKVLYDRNFEMPLTVLLRALTLVPDDVETELLTQGTSKEIYDVFRKLSGDQSAKYITATIESERDYIENIKSDSVCEQCLLWIYKNIKPQSIPILRDAVLRLEHALHDLAAYDLMPVGRKKLNSRFKLDGIINPDLRVITKYDIVAAAVELIEKYEQKVMVSDDIDHFSNRRVRTPGEQIARNVRKGFRDMEIAVKQRMEFVSDITSVSAVFDSSPVKAAVRSFFSTSPLCQMLDQNNPLSEIRHKRTVSALGPGGLDRSRAGLAVRDIHHTHYGRICCVETPEGKNTGLISRVSLYGVIDEYGFIQTPYRKVIHQVPCTKEALLNRIPSEDYFSSNGKLIFPAGVRITQEALDSCNKIKWSKSADKCVNIIPFVSNEIVYMDAEEENNYTIGLSTTKLNQYGEFIEERINCRHFPSFLDGEPKEIDYLDISPQQGVGITASCIPFLEHDDGHRALMGTNMQSQAVPLLRPEIPFIMTGMENYAALTSSHIQLAHTDGVVRRADSYSVLLQKPDRITEEYVLRKYARTNKETCVAQRPTVSTGDIVKKGDVIADTTCTYDGVLALGHNPVVAFIAWDGSNFEDAIVLSKKLIQDDKFASIDIIEETVKVGISESGQEEITRDIPGVSADALRHLDKDGIAKVGTMLHAGDIIVGKVAPARDREYKDAAEVMLRSIFGKDAAPVRDVSLRMPPNTYGRVIRVKTYTPFDDPDMEPGITKVVKVSLAKIRPIEVGDKMSGRHGNKGVVSRIAPTEDMPYMENGTPVDICLNPLGVPGRMNLGQLLETHLGWAAKELGIRIEMPVFDSPTVHDIQAELARAWMYDTAWDDMCDRAWDKAIKDKEGINASNPFAYGNDFFIATEFEEKYKQKNYIPKSYEDIIMDYISGINAADHTNTESVRHLSLQKQKEIVCRDWLRHYDYEYDDLFDFSDVEEDSPDIIPINSAAVCAACIIWLQITALKYSDEWNSFQHKNADFREMKEEELELIIGEWGNLIKEPTPVMGKQWLRDGRTGKRFDYPVTVGVMNMIKLHHLVQDKVNARSIGTYSMVTQQPLGGKAKHGGQRMGEMEVWAIEAYGAANVLQEMMTIKSDDIDGRELAWKAFIQDKNSDIRKLPGSFHVLVKELMSLGLVLTANDKTGNRHIFS